MGSSSPIFGMKMKTHWNHHLAIAPSFYKTKNMAGFRGIKLIHVNSNTAVFPSPQQLLRSYGFRGHWFKGSIILEGKKWTSAAFFRFHSSARWWPQSKKSAKPRGVSERWAAPLMVERLLRPWSVYWRVICTPFTTLNHLLLPGIIISYWLEWSRLHNNSLTNHKDGKHKKLTKASCHRGRQHWHLDKQRQTYTKCLSNCRTFGYLSTWW